jgi:hypothetical protein
MIRDPRAKKRTAHCHSGRSEAATQPRKLSGQGQAFNLIIVDSAERAISRDASLALNMTVQLMCAGRNRCAASWTTFARHVLFSSVHAEILHQDLWLPDE